METFSYGPRVVEHFRNPRNVGEIKDPDGVGRVGNPVCGDLMEIQIKVKDDRIADIKFRTFGCGAAVATSSMVTELAKGKTLDEALRLTRQDVASELGGLPPIKMHCSNLAADALHAAIADYRARRAAPAPAAAAEFDYDVIIVGGGPGGLSTAILCAYRGLHALVLEAESLGGILTSLCPDKTIENYPGLGGTITCRELAENWIREARERGVTLKLERVTGIGTDKMVKTTRGRYRGRIIVLATGSTPAGLGLPREKEFAEPGRGISYYVTSPEQYAGKRVLVVGGGDSAVSAALSLVDIAEQVTLAVRADVLRAAAGAVERLNTVGKVAVRYHAEPVALEGADRLTAVRLRDTKTGIETALAVDAAVFAVGLVPNTDIFRELGIELDERGYIKVDRSQKTNLDGFFAVGDIATDLELVVVAVAHGAIVANQAYVQLRQPYWAKTC